MNGISRFKRLESCCLLYTDVLPFISLKRLSANCLAAGLAFFHAPDTFQCIINPLSEHTDPSKHCVMVTWRAIRVTPAYNTLHYPLACRFLTLKWPAAVPEASVCFSLPSIACAHHFTRDYPSTIVSVKSTVRRSIQLCCACAIWNYRHPCLL